MANRNPPRSTYCRTCSATAFFSAGTDGSPWRDRAGHLWLDPYNPVNWDYNVDLAIDAAKRGFREIQWDYVRFPSEGRSRPMRFPKKDARSEARVIGDFLRYAREKLRPYDVQVSADVFGLTNAEFGDIEQEARRVSLLQ